MTTPRLFRAPKLRRVLKRLLHPPIIDVGELIQGRNVVIGSGVEIRCRRLILGDGVTIRSGTRIEMDDLVVGDYTTINNDCLLTGTDWCRIGHNCWFGHFTIIDSIGTTQIGDGVGVGAHSQLWTHAYFGDVLEGSRFSSRQQLRLDDDVWLVGHCVVSPIHAQRRSMALVGSVVTKPMEENHVYGGVPAKDVTDRLGPQFEDRPLSDRRPELQAHLDEFLSERRPRRNRIEIVDRIDKSRPTSQFALLDRQYLKNNYPEEVAFMRFLLPRKAKFLPHPSTDWIAESLQPPT